jgi:Mor family transcriptional regulator
MSIIIVGPKKAAPAKRGKEKKMARHMLDGITIERLAEEYDLSVVRTFQIIKRAREQLFRHL